MPQHVPPRIYRRVPFETAVRLRFGRFHGFVEQYSANLSLGGMFIKSDELPPLGTEVAVEFRLEDGFELIRGRGRVVWLREAAEGDEPGGFGLRFLELTPGSRELIFRLVERRVREGDRVFDLDDAAPATAASHLVHDEERLAAPPWDRPSPRGGEEGARPDGGAAGGEAALYGRAAREAAEEKAGAGGTAVGAGEEEVPAAADDPEASFAGLVEPDEDDEEGEGRLRAIAGDGGAGAVGGPGAAEPAPAGAEGGGAEGAEVAASAEGVGDDGEKVRGPAAAGRGTTGTAFAAAGEGEAGSGGDRAERLDEAIGAAAGAAGAAAAGAVALAADARERAAAAGGGEAARGSSWVRDAARPGEPAGVDGVAVPEADAAGDGGEPGGGGAAGGDGSRPGEGDRAGADEEHGDDLGEPAADAADPTLGPDPGAGLPSRSPAAGTSAGLLAADAAAPAALGAGPGARSATADRLAAGFGDPAAADPELDAGRGSAGPGLDAGRGSAASPHLADDRPGIPAAHPAPAAGDEPWPEPAERTGHGFAGAGRAGGSGRRGGRLAAIAAVVAVVAVGGFFLFRALAPAQDGNGAVASPRPAAVAEGDAGDGAAGASAPAAGAAGTTGPPASPSAPSPSGERSGGARETAAPPSAPAAAPPPADGPPTVERIDWRRRDGGLDFDVAGGRPIAADQVDHFRVGGERPRLVVRIAGIERPYAGGDVAVGGPLVERVRTGFHPAAGGGGSVHLVFDLATAGASAAVDAAGGGVRVRIEGP